MAGFYGLFQGLADFITIFFDFSTLLSIKAENTDTSAAVRWLSCGA